MNLTEKQAAVLRFIRRFLREKKYPPSTREIQSAFGFQSQTAAVNHLNALERNGAIRRIPGIARGLIILEDAQGTP